MLNGRSLTAWRLHADPFGVFLGVTPKVFRVQVGDVQETVALQPELYKGGLDRRLDVDDAALVDVADVGLGAGALLI